MNDDIVHERIGNTVHVVLNRPKEMNSLTFEMYERLAALCADVELGGPVKAIVISGAGAKAFAAGTDIAQFRAFNCAQDALDYEAGIDRVLSVVENCPVPTIAAITGACIGGGAALAAACDIRICDRQLRFGFPIARTLGNCLSGSSLNRLSELLGAARLREILITARLIKADEALASGLVSEVLHDSETVIARAFELATLVAGHAPLTLSAAKQGLNRLRTEGAAADFSDLIESTYMSEDFQEGIEAFLAKRKPVWKGR